MTALSTRTAADGEQAELLPTYLLDAIRGMAALYVLFTHARIFLLLSAASVLTLGLHGLVRDEMAVVALTRYGTAAVMAFFIISGYAIHYRQAFRIAGRADSVISWPKFALNRARRLYPALIVAVALTFVLETLSVHINPGFFQGQSPDPDFGYMHRSPLLDYVGALLFLQGWVTTLLTYNGSLWSLSYEAFYYVTYPLVLLASRRLGPTLTLVLFAMCGFVGEVAGLNGIHTQLLSVVTLWPLWVAGAWIADVRAGRVNVEQAWLRWAAWAGVLGACALGAGLAATKHIANDGNVELVWGVLFFGPLAWLAAGRHTASVRRTVTRVCWPFMGLGVISYSLYVVHYPIVAFLSALWIAHHPGLPATPWLYLSGIALSLAVASAVYVLAERPFLTRRQRVHAVPNETTAIASVEPLRAPVLG